ncbi:MAG TPA: RNA 2',3'-cyclic phosphodiesterase [Patescibacteria group bacterium]|nr:RNA 2',3'-cyclic phosphodiesterase [Patescibacteria group bacterium]
MRTFIAVSLPQGIKQQLGLLQEQLKRSAADVKWVQPHNIHVTLKFLGEIEEQKLGQITAMLQDTVKDKACFTASMSGLGAFPRMTAPRVIWSGINKGKEDLIRIAKELEEKSGILGVPPEDRPFTCHLTLGRVRSSANLHRLVKILTETAQQPDQEFPVTKLTLFKSTLAPTGPVYEPLTEASLITT